MDQTLHLRDWLGRRVDVIVDRPLGSLHPRHPDIRYAVNYGYIPGTCAPDGEPLDVYVLGPGEPIASCTATVVAIIRRRDDAEDKLVTVTEGQFGVDEIAAATDFQERYFDSYIEASPR
ncbi:MAG: inorganic diphosphatase [Dehalococcoidia bacterium]|nr:inorganic diphosphatase [Dehalococcoidia bacterium]MCA9844827.1 inorganic diphosphatase [Dehalococcoidia bacterium]MCA9852955.1 inorganic diphosphatase [Dehalococcoidia bacterium]